MDYYKSNTVSHTTSGKYRCTVSDIAAGNYIAVVSNGGIYANNNPTIQDIANGTGTLIESVEANNQFSRANVFSLSLSDTGSVTFEANSTVSDAKLGMSVILIK